MTEEERENKILKCFDGIFGIVEGKNRKDRNKLAEKFSDFRYGWLSGYRTRKKEEKSDG